MRLDRNSATLRAAVVALILTGAAGCSELSGTQKGAIIGAATGGAVGGIIGNNNGSTAKGAIIGAAIGGVAGAIIGNQMDKQAKELEQNIPGATVERVGEGIQVTFASGLLFGFDSAIVKGDARSNLNELSRSLDKYADSNLLIVGHTDAKGTESYNQDLSERRAESAAGYLISQGVSRDRIGTRGLGEMEPVASNETDAGRAKNRRVEVAIYASEELRDRAKREAASR